MPGNPIRDRFRARRHMARALAGDNENPIVLAMSSEIAMYSAGDIDHALALAEDAVRLFDCIHSLDRPSLVAALACAMEKTARQVPCFVQVNIGAEAQKGGCAIADLPSLLAEARAAGIPLAGLMCVPPAGIEAAPFFALADKLARDNFVDGGLTGLSMGMSEDFETAIQMGATHIRVGSALFGARG